MDWKVHMMISYLLLMSSFTNGNRIQVLQHRSKKCIDQKWGLLINKPHLVTFHESILFSPLSKWVECSPMVRETRVQYQVKSYQRLKKWYWIPPCLTLIRYLSRAKWSNPGKGIVPSPTPQWGSYWKGSLRVALDYTYFYYIYIYIYIKGSSDK